MNYNAPRKPRRTRGTPAHATANRIAFGVLSAGLVFGVLYHFTGGQSLMNKLKVGYGVDVYNPMVAITPKMSNVQNVPKMSSEDKDKE